MMRPLLALSLLSMALRLTAEEPPRTITARGEAALDVTPDEVVVSLGVETLAQTVRAAKQSNEDACARLLKIIRELPVPEADIGTAALQVRPQEKESGHAAKGIEGYFVTRDYIVTLRHARLFESLIDAALGNGANRIAGFEFRTSKLLRLREEARNRAASAARDKAASLAKALGATLGPPRVITEDNTGWSGFAGYNSLQVQADDDEGGGSLPSGQIRIRARVTVTFDLVVS